jgi:hypothetical protein
MATAADDVGRTAEAAAAAHEEDETLEDKKQRAIL